MISGILSAMMVLTTVVTPMTVMASEIIPEDELREYVSSLPELKDVKDQLDPDEIVEAKDYEVDFGTEIDLRNDFTNMEIPNRDKVKVSFFEAKNAAGTDYSANNADTYKAVYYVEPMNEMHPVYRVSRSITVKEPVTEPQVPEEGSDGGDDGQSGEEAEDAEADPVPESEAAMIPEPEAAESYVPDTFEDSEESSVFYEFTEEAFQEEMAATTQAEDYPYMMFQTHDGTVQTLASASLTITFSNGNMVVSNGTESKVIALTDLSKMFFSKTTEITGINDINTNGSQEVEVFTTGGVKLGKFESITSAKTSLKPGIYVIKNSQKTYRIAVK